MLYLKESKIAGIMYWICAVGVVVSILLILPIPETFGRDLSDKINQEPGHHVRKEEQSVQQCNTETSTSFTQQT